MAASEWHARQFALPWLEPVDAYARLRALNPLLLDGPGAHPEATQSHLAMGMLWEARCIDGRWSRTWADGSNDTLGDGLVGLRHITALPDVPAAAGFSGGLIGYFGYEATRLFEPTLAAPHPRRTPDIVLRLCRDAVVFDRRARTAHLHLADVDKDAMEARAKAYQAAWSQPVSIGPAAPLGPWTPSLGEDEFLEAVARVRDLIHNGDLFQANIATRFTAPCNQDPLALYAALARANPSPYMALLDFGDHQIVSSSPEQLLAMNQGTIRTRPIAGTRGRGTDAADDARLEQELLADPKERAEHTMLVDLLRNDVAKVSRPGTTRVTEAMSVERYQHVMHLVSQVEGTLREGVDFVDCMQAVFPGGTITGAPKHRACMRIEEAEPVARGPYTGSAGYLAWDGSAHWNILIRTLVLQDGVASLHAGSGIVADSEPAAEWAEANRKARSLRLESGPAATRLGEVTRHGAWRPATPPGHVEAHVLLIDNYDSFVHNLSDACAHLGARTTVVRNDVPVPPGDFTHVILGPGPGWPADSGSTMEVARTLPDVPVLGICLGHQALAAAHGGSVQVAPAVHGKTSPVHHNDPWLADLPDPFIATRYHSLVVTPPLGWTATAWLGDGTVMAMRHPERPVVGLQFHPESFCTEGGLHILHRFLQ